MTIDGKIGSAKIRNICLQKHLQYHRIMFISSSAIKWSILSGFNTFTLQESPKSNLKMKH